MSIQTVIRNKQLHSIENIKEKICLLGATKLVSLAKCLVPRHEIPERTVKSLISWCLASINELPITVSTIIIQWTVGNIFLFFFFF